MAELRGIHRERTASLARQTTDSLMLASPMAELLDCDPGDIVFTAGGTEADNLAVFGVIEAAEAGRSAPRSSITPCSNRSNSSAA